MLHFSSFERDARFGSGNNFPTFFDGVSVPIQRCLLIIRRGPICAKFVTQRGTSGAGTQPGAITLPLLLNSFGRTGHSLLNECGIVSLPCSVKCCSKGPWFTYACRNLVSLCVVERKLNFSFLFHFQFDKYAPKLDNPYFRHSNVSADVPLFMLPLTTALLECL